jgi:cytochrome c oxidase subunit III
MPRPPSECAGVRSASPHPEEDFTYSLGMIIAIASFSMMFGALFFIYLGIRSRAPVWPPVATPRLPVGLAVAGTAAMIASSAAFARGARALHRGRPRALSPWVAATVVLGATFLGLQLAVLGALWRAGLRPSTGAYGSVFCGLTALHALHAAAGLVVLLIVLSRALAGAYTEHNIVRIRMCGIFWHFVDVVWILMFIAFYLL